MRAFRILLLMMCMGNILSLMAQTRTYHTHATLNTHSAFGKHDDELGIKANTNNGNIRVTVNPRDVSTGRNIYDAHSNNESNDDIYIHNGFPAEVNVCSDYSTATACIIYPTTTSSKKWWKTQITKQAQDESSWFWGEPRSFRVTVTVQTSGNATIYDINKIKLPGIEALYFHDFVETYSNPCHSTPSTIGCDVVADFKDVGTNANDPKRKPIVIAHRGFHGMRGVAENTIFSVQNAYNNGYRYVEVDLRMTEDYIPIVFHDDYYGYQTNYAVLDNTDPLTYTEGREWSEISNLKYRDRYWEGAYKTAHVLRDNGSGQQTATDVEARLGNTTQITIGKFEELADYIKGKDLMVFLDIKSVPTDRNFETFKQCIMIGIEKNVLHQLGFKMVRTNLPDGHPKKLFMTLANAEAYLGNIYDIFKDDLNIHVVDYDPGLTIDENGNYEAGNGPDFINDWISQNNIIGFEFDIQYNPIFSASSLKNYNISQYGNLSAWEYTKSLNFRTGLWSSISLDPRGRPGHDPSTWGTGGVMIKNLNSIQHYKDNRARLEVVSWIQPQYITHDRPDEVSKFLNALGKLNPDTNY